MKIKFKTGWTKHMKEPSTQMKDRGKYSNDDYWYEINVSSVALNDRKKLLELAKKDGSENGNRVARKLVILDNLENNEKGECPKTLEPLAAALGLLIRKTPHKWLLKDSQDGFPELWFVEKVTYSLPSRHGAAHVSVQLVSVKRGELEKDRITIHRKNIMKKKLLLTELLADFGYYLETKEAVEENETYEKKYKEICDLVGAQFLAVGSAEVSRGRWSSREWLSMERDGKPSPVIMDDISTEEADEDDDGNKKRAFEERAEKSIAIETQFWAKKGLNTSDDNRDDDDDAEIAEDQVFVPPLHPYVRVFDMNRHEFALIHVGNLTKYDYKKDLINKLVLSHEKKSLINILIKGTSVRMEDVIEGKTGGIIVVATGNPGTGKTLTAEVFSEEIEKPLYIVQCSQLGTDEKALEKKLAAVLDRATRWNAILLIDEADVYVRARGDDIQQNAIVGVFLRVLEYYRGVLFLTSNRETVIDDAIMSRATAWIKYVKPTQAELKEIWEILSKQFEVPLDSETVLTLSKVFVGISGRNVKNMLKLAKLLSAQEGRKITVETFKSVSKFLALDIEPLDAKSCF